MDNTLTYDKFSNTYILKIDKKQFGYISDHIEKFSSLSYANPRKSALIRVAEYEEIGVKIEKKIFYPYFSR
jgi:hypothetical protein